jgi:hypothetical protein
LPVQITVSELKTEELAGSASGGCFQFRKAARAGSFVLPLIAAGVLSMPQSASAIPSFARQTGQPCSTCHTAFPQLTPYGRAFKLGGYQAGGGLTWDEALPVAGMVIPTFTHTQANQDAPPAPNAHTNNNPWLNQATFLYGGVIPVPGGGLGAFIQITWDEASEHVALDQSDIRYVQNTQLFDYDVTLGIDINNSPSIEDPWNTTYAFQFPFVSSTIAPAFGPPSPFIQGGIAGVAVGTGAYAWVNNSFYLAFTAYQNLSHQTLSFLGIPGASGATSIDGVAPYWRAAYEVNFLENHYLEIGTYGIYANTLPNRVAGFGFDQILDVAVDAQYQWIADPHNITVRLNDVRETQQLNSTYLQGTLGAPSGLASSNLYQYMNRFDASVEYVYDHTWSLTAGYFNVTGSADALLWGGTSLKNIPNGEGVIVDAAYLPFSHGGPKEIWPWLNARLGVTYTSYLKLFGGTNNFDGLGHNAGQNNTLFLYGWVAF